MIKNSDILMNPNELVQYLKKPSKNFTRDDIMKFIEAKGITMINFRYVADDGKLKTLKLRHSKYFVPFIIVMENLLRVPLSIFSEKHIHGLRKRQVTLKNYM